ncbi:MAG TPA: NYN domain-containing protein [Longimicrobiales bacterium]|nr:NYN domain-containing protein [Longimicrobiales bacterium]
MNTPYQAVPHGAGSNHPVAAPNAALLIDFDNVTMGMRSDLSKEFRKLLDSDIIRGKVTVQRAYADWRRYPQYIVPLSENSIDLIFAPAYGSSKKNATDIRMAIDGMELIFTRPEIGTYILLTGDSDFSSLVLKLKEYGKYVIGVGLQESSSDILVQNCDEYYSYTNFAGLQKTTEAGDRTSLDPWMLVEKSVKLMSDRGDVMRSDRLKQVMRELDPQFDEGKFGFSKFSRFVTEAASRELLKLRKADNGQYDIFPTSGSKSSGDGSSSGAATSSERRGDKRGRGRGRDRDRDRKRDRSSRDSAEASGVDSSRDSGADSGPDHGADRGREPSRSDEGRAASTPAEEPETAAATGEFSEGIEGAYEVLLAALDRLRDADRYPARGSDVKRRMLEIVTGFDEAEYGFPKFSLFLKAAEEDGLITVTRLDNGGFEVEQADASAAQAAEANARSREEQAEAEEQAPEATFERTDRHADDTSSDDEFEDEPTSAATEPAATKEPIVEEMTPGDFVDDETPGRRLGPRGGTTRRRTDGPPPLFEGQGQPASTTETRPVEKVAPQTDVFDDDDEFDEDIDEGDIDEGDIEQPDAPDTAPAAEPLEAIDAEALGLPTGRDAQIAYLTNSYKGIGEKTAEQVVDAFGDSLFEVLNNEPDRVRDLLPAGRADHLLEAWEEDIERRVVRLATDH